jgi:hypothetical protein
VLDSASTWTQIAGLAEFRTALFLTRPERISPPIDTVDGGPRINGDLDRSPLSRLRSYARSSEFQFKSSASDRDSSAQDRAYSLQVRRDLKEISPARAGVNAGEDFFTRCQRRITFLLRR